MIKKYIQDSIAEFNNVTWPTKKQGIRLTIIVFVFMIAAATALGFVDKLLSLLMEFLISL